MTSVILAKWGLHAPEKTCEIVLPDGCRDLILRCQPGQVPVWFVSPLQTCPKTVTISAGTQLLGFRLRPGAQITPELSRLAALVGDDLDQVSALLEENCRRLPVLDDALSRLSLGGGTVAHCARDLGISARTLQRLVTRGTGRKPSFWLRLSQARRAATHLRAGGSLAALADAFGYADQAHMTRAFRAWFGMTPAHLRRNQGLQTQLFQPGIATGEQISIR